MHESDNDIDKKSKDAAQNIRLAFDKNAWNKMEELLNKEDKKPAAQIISNTLVADKTSIGMSNEKKILKTGEELGFEIRPARNPDNYCD